MWSFENDKVRTKFGMVHLSRILASWRNEGGEMPDYHDDKSLYWRWCSEILGMLDEDIGHSLELYANGKLELEMSATRFLKENKGGS